MKLMVLILALVVAFAATGAEAGNGNGNGNANNGGDNGSGNGSANANGHDKSKTNVTVYSPAGLVTAGAEQNIALDAVKSGDALPLDQIEPVAIRQWGGRVIDAHLQRTNGTLLYRLTVVSDAGVSRRVYYDARTGAPVVAP